MLLNYKYQLIDVDVVCSLAK